MNGPPIVYHPDYVTPLPAGHRFPMGKFSRLAERLGAEGILSAQNAHRPKPAPRSWIERVHEKAYVRAFCAGRLSRDAERRIGLPWSPGLVRRTVTAVGGTVRTAELALEHGIACNVAGGTHHAFPDAGSGFCILHDLAVAARVLLDRGAVRQVLIVDLDVHQGDATARIFRDEPRVFTFSMHCGRNFPARKQESDLDVALEPETGDAGYMAELGARLPPLLDRVAPDLVIYDAGVDPHADDRLGKLALTRAGLGERDRFVLGACLERRLPVAGVIGGGYSDDLDELVDRHAILHRSAHALASAALRERAGRRCSV